MSADTPRPVGRRIAEVRRRRPGAPVVIALVLVVLATLAVVLTRSPEPGGAPRGSVGALVDRTLLACPGPLDAAGGQVRGRTEVGLAPVKGPRGPLGDDGTVRVGPSGEERAASLSRGELLDVDSDRGVSVDAAGSAAAGVFGDRVDRVGATTATGRCVAPRAEWWFTGAGAGLDHSSVLTLANVDPGPAVVDLRVLGPDREVQTVGTTGITVQPGSRQRIDLTEIAPQTDELALEVHASRGRVVAAVDDSLAGAGAPGAGSDWLTGTDRATRQVRLAGIPPQARARTLLVANPSELEAVVEVQVAGSSGTFAPTGLQPVTVAPGAVEAVDLADVLPRREAVTLRLRSRVPVLATLRASRQGDTAYAAAVSPLTGPAAAPLLRGIDASVQLTAGATGGKAELTAYDRDGERVDRTTLTLEPAATGTWEPEGGAGYVLVRPTDGRLHGAVAYSGSGVSTVPLRPLPIRVLRPTVQPALR